jgi:putative aldouronate transport system substrate-binding protein
MLLSAALLVGMTACAGGTASPAEASGGDATPESSGEKTYDEKVTITYATVQARQGYDYNNGDPYATFMSEKFNYELEVAALGWDNWTEQLRVWISSQDMPDVAVYNYGHAEAAGFAEQGLVKRFPDDWKERWPNTAAEYARTGIGPVAEEQMGGTYYVPRALYNENQPGDPIAGHQSLHFRKDWAEAVGMEVKNNYTIDEVMEMARLIKDQDPGGVGENLIPITGTPGNNNDLFIQTVSTNYDEFYKDTDGVYKWGPASPDTLKGLQIYYEAFSTGLLDPEFYILNAEEDRAKFETTGVAAMLMDQLPTAEIGNRRVKFATDTGLDADAVEGFAVMLDSDGNYHRRGAINFWGTICFSPNVSDEVFERWMDVMDYNATPEGYAGSVMGLWDVDFKQNEDGSYESLLPEGTILVGEPGESKYPSMGYILGSTICWDDFAFVNPNIDLKYRDEARALYKVRNEQSTPETFAPVNWELYTYDSPNKRRVSYEFSTEFANLVTSATSAEDLAQRHSVWVEEQNPIIQPVLDELNAMNQ